MSANEPEGFAAMPTTEEPEQVSPVSSPKPWQKPRCDDGHLLQHAGCDLKLCQQAGKEAARVARRRNTKAHRLLARAEDAMQKAHEDQALQQLLSDPCSS